MDVVCYPNPTLKQECAEVDPTDASLDMLANQMLDVMYEERGIGLAASQVGVLKKVVVMDLDPDHSQPMLLLNPKIVEESEETETTEEGCLSFPGIDVLIERPAAVTIETHTREGDVIRLEAEGIFARCAQHEIDHINGITMLDRATPERRAEALAKLRENITRG